ncbi:MAG: InlB B-repeat-containing protein [Paludibacteraceae bacterium]|nr:InlB B-repeat-containing protein [Paludibacteraceae bacterium]
MKNNFSKFFAVLMFATGMLASGNVWGASTDCSFAQGETIYFRLDNNVNWGDAGAYPAAVFYYSNNSAKDTKTNSTNWDNMGGSCNIGSSNYTKMTSLGNNMYSVTIPRNDIGYIRIVRVSGGDANWTWNSQNKMCVDDAGTNNCIYCNAFENSGQWETYGGGRTNTCGEEPAPAGDKYKVEFVTFCSQTKSTQYVAEGGKATNPGDLSKIQTQSGNHEVATFKGWYKDEACTQSFDFNTTINEDTKVYAKWELRSEDFYLVGDLWMYENQNDWWNNRNPKFTKSADKRSMSVTYIAPKGLNRFEVIRGNDWGYKVPMDLDPNSPVALATKDGHMNFTLTKAQKVTITYNGRFSVTAEDFTPFYQDGWYISIEGNSWGKVEKADGSLVDMAGNWAKQAANNKFRQEGDSGIILIRNAAAGDHKFKVMQLNNDDGRAGIELFNSPYVDMANSTDLITWKTRSTAFGVDYPGDDNFWRNIYFNLKQNADIKIIFNGGLVSIVEVVTPEYKVTFDSKGGSEVASQDVKEGKYATKPTDPTKDGYNFLGWSETDGGDVVDVTTIAITAAKTFYARWERQIVAENVLYHAVLNSSEDQTDLAVTGGTISYSDLYTPEGPAGTCRIVKLQFWGDNNAWNYAHVIQNGNTYETQISTSDAESNQWYEIPVGESFSPNWTSNSYPLYYFVNVKTGKYLCRGNGQYGANGDWYYYVTTAVDEATGNACKWFYDNTQGTHIVCREGVGNELKKSFQLHDCNVGGAGNTFDQDGKKPKLVCSYTPDPNGNVWTKLREAVVVEAAAPIPGSKTAKITINETDYYRMDEETAVRADMNVAIAQGNIIRISLYNDADAAATVTVKDANGTTLATVSVPSKQTLTTDYKAADAWIGVENLLLSAEADMCLSAIQIVALVPQVTLQQLIDETAAGETLILPIDFIGQAGVVDKTMTIDAQGYEVGNLTLKPTANVTLSSALKVADLTLWANENENIQSAQLTGETNLTIGGDVWFDVDFEAGDAIEFGWYTVAVPFTVDGVYYKNSEGTRVAAKSGKDYMLYTYDSNKRAAGQNGWTKYTGNMNPGMLYLITMDDALGVSTFCFKKANGTTIGGPSEMTLQAYPATNPINAGWNGVANSTLQYRNISFSGNKVQVYSHTDDAFHAFEIANNTFVVGSAFFAQSEGETLKLETPATAGTLLAPTRSTTTSNNSEWVVELTRDSKQQDRVFLSAEETATETYEIGHDLVKMAYQTPKVAQVAIAAYGVQLCDAELPWSETNEALFPLTLTAPQNGTYTLHIATAAEGTLYLLHNGQVIWNLSESDYDFDLTKGKNTEYSLMLQRKITDIVTATDKVQSGLNVEKFIRNNRMYILKNNTVQDVLGK